MLIADHGFDICFCVLMATHSFELNVQDDETTLSEEEELAKAESHEPVDEVTASFSSVIQII